MGYDKEIELAWAAGFFDGEGSVYLMFPKGGRRWPYIRLSITQHNRETLERFRTALGGLGRIYYGRNNKPERNEYVVNGIAAVREVFMALAPYLSGPKREQGERAMAAWSAARIGIDAVVLCEECGQLAVRELERGRQPNLLYCSKRCRNRARNRRYEEKVSVRSNG